MNEKIENIIKNINMVEKEIEKIDGKIDEKYKNNNNDIIFLKELIDDTLDKYDVILYSVNEES